MDTVSGVSVGKKENEIVAVGEGKSLTVKIRGRWVYAKKCLKPEKIDEIYRPEVMRHDSTFALVLAVGDGCGKVYELSEEDERKEGMTNSVPLDIKVNDKIFAPDTHEWGIKRSPYNDNDFFLHECIIIGKIEE